MGLARWFNSKFEYIGVVPEGSALDLTNHPVVKLCVEFCLNEDAVF